MGRKVALTALPEGHWLTPVSNKLVHRLVMLLVLSALSVGTRAQVVVAYAVPAGTTANQFIPNPLGMDFDVVLPVTVFSLGVFDSGQDGLTLSHVVRLYDRTTQQSVAMVTIPAGISAPLVGGSRFIDLSTPLSLPAGFLGSIVAEINSADGNGNTHGGGGVSTLNTGGGAINFVGGGRVSDDGPGVFPARLDGGPANRYLAGTFTFGITAVPEPSTALLVVMGLVALAAVTRFRTKTRQR